MKRRDFVATAAVAPFVIGSARAQDRYPVKPIRLVVPFAPGGSSSIVARAFATEMAKGLGQEFIIDNRPGGGGNIAMEAVAKAEPDGYTLIMGHIGTLAVNPFMFSKLPFDTNRDFAAVSLLAKVPSIYVVNAGVPVKNLKELIDYCKANPGKVYYGSAGNGSAGHLAFEYLKLTTKMDITHVPYKGTGPQLTDLIGGLTQASSAGTPPLLPHIRSGKLRAISVGTTKRLPELPDVMTIAEQGYPGFETVQWYGMNAPGKTPPAILKRLADEAARAAKSKEVQARFADDSTEEIGSTPEAYAAFIKAEQTRWSQVVKEAKIKAD
ncbi:MAG: tripartite tricarboxylate transporter substrate binding protein [Burkholderiales bacterium]|nr:tripartite tricarboxylate transporter substrate binding protein [Burkholderiales bacterium]